MKIIITSELLDDRLFAYTLHNGNICFFVSNGIYRALRFELNTIFKYRIKNDILIKIHNEK